MVKTEKTRKRSYNVHEAKTQLSRLLERAHAGEEIVLAKAGTPYAKLVPLDEGRDRRPGQLRGRIVVPDDFFEQLPEEELRAWEGEEGGTG